MTASAPENRASRGLRAYSKFVVLATLCLVFLGAQVNSHDAGLAVPDWPTTYGVNMFLFHWSNWVGGIFHEHVHRLVASFVGMLTIGLMVWLLWKDHRSWLKSLGIVAFATVVIQGLLGGITVRYLLPTPISVAHGMLAQTFFLLTIFIAYALSRERRERNDKPRGMSANAAAGPAVLLLAVVYIQLFLGALMRHTGSGLAIPDFPTMGGQWLPVFTQETLANINAWRANVAFETGRDLEPVTLAQVWVHFIHRLNALLVVLATGGAAAVAWRIRHAHPRTWHAAVAIAALVVLQIVLGVLTIWTIRVPVVASLHVATGALILGLAMVFALRACPATFSQSEQRATAHEWQSKVTSNATS